LLLNFLKNFFQKFLKPFQKFITTKNIFFTKLYKLNSFPKYRFNKTDFKYDSSILSVKVIMANKQKQSLFQIQTKCFALQGFVKHPDIKYRVWYKRLQLFNIWNSSFAGLTELIFIYFHFENVFEFSEGFGQFMVSMLTLTKQLTIYCKKSEFFDVIKTFEKYAQEGSIFVNF
jgi:hypothetical protein